MKCPNCGADIKPGVNVCVNCGYYLNSEDNSEDDKFSDLVDFTDEDEEEDESSDNKKKSSKFKFDIKGNLIYILLGIVLLFSIILLIYGITSRGSSSGKSTSPSSTPSVEERDTVVDVDGYKVTVPKGYDYQVQDKGIFISNDNYNFSFRINSGNYKTYSDDMDGLTRSLTKSGYNIRNAVRKNVDEKEILVYTILIDNETKYLYLSEYDDNNIAMGIITLHGNYSVDSVCKAVIKVLDSVEKGESDSTTKSNSGSGVDDSSGVAGSMDILLN